MKSKLLLVCIWTISFVEICLCRNIVMPWMCLERCGENVQSDLATIERKTDLFSSVSFEAYDLGPNSTIIWNDFTSVAKDIQGYGLQNWPMITTTDLDKIRQVLKNPDPFIEAAIEVGVKNAYTGYNIDWEPDEDATVQDGIDFSQFLDKFAIALHGKNMKLSVDVARWSSLWNFELIAATNVDKVMVMDTYAGEFLLFEALFYAAVVEISIDKLGVGLGIENFSNNQPYTDDELRERFNLINYWEIKEIDIWDMPIPDNWWPFLHDFVNRKNNTSTVDFRAGNYSNQL